MIPINSDESIISKLVKDQSKLNLKKKKNLNYSSVRHYLSKSFIMRNFFVSVNEE